jgi:hypothetical protein
MDGIASPPLTEDPDTLTNLTFLLEDIGTGSPAGPLRDLLLTSLLVPGRKKDDGVRPIAMGEVFVKLSELYLLSLITPATLQSIFGGIQFGYSKGGVERAILALQAHIERNPEDTVTSLDIKNGYNSLDRKAMLTELFRHRSLHHLWRISHWCYSSPSSLLVTSNGSIAATISSGRGTRQGCVLGGLLFCLTIHPIYRQAISELPDTTATAIIDDFNFACRPRNTSTILDRLNSLLPSLGLELAPAKCNILWPNDTTPPPTSVSNLASHYGYKLHIGVLPTLGSAIGLSAPLLQSFAARTLAKHQLILTTLAHAAMPAQHAFAILRLCLASTPNFLLRTLPQPSSPPAAASLTKPCSPPRSPSSRSILRPCLH